MDTVQKHMYSDIYIYIYRYGGNSRFQIVTEMWTKLVWLKIWTVMASYERSIDVSVSFNENFYIIIATVQATVAYLVQQLSTGCMTEGSEFESQQGQEF
jgi:hypothetical protein